MFEIRLDDELIASLNSWEGVYIKVIDLLPDDDSSTLKKLYQHYALCADEDLSYEPEGMTDKKTTISISFTIDVPVKANQHILEG